METFFYSSPIGQIKLQIGSKGLRSLQFIDSTNSPLQAVTHFPNNSLYIEVHKQLDSYFNNKIKTFDLPLEIEGTDFQKRVWHHLMQIPFGTTLSYAALAEQLGDPNVIRAAASANGKNPILLIVPCHRVIGLRGSLTGYAGGLNRKQWLLVHEGAIASPPQTLF